MVVKWEFSQLENKVIFLGAFRCLGPHGIGKRLIDVVVDNMNIFLCFHQTKINIFIIFFL